MIRITALLVGALLLIMTISGHEPLKDTRAGDLSGCPDLERGKPNPVDCVKELQLRLQDSGYSQRVTGNFGEQTEANVRDFQRRHNINPVSGIVGPKTRAELVGDGTPPAQPSDYRHSYCEDGACHFYLRRSTTSLYARRLDKHPAVGSAVTSTLLIAACRAFKAVKPATVACNIIGIGGGATADTIANELDKAARQHACLRLTARLIPADLRFLKAAPDNSWRCSD
jgi:Putative peptidoglycan binding domain